MHKVAMTIALVMTPALLAAQARASAEASSSAEVKSGATEANASTNASVDAEVAIARKRGLPTRPIRRRAAEGEAKGATAAQVALAARGVRMNLEAAHEALVTAGRKNPHESETEHGAIALERGYTRAQLEAVAKSAPSDRSLVVAFDVLTRLAARGVPVDNAVAQVRSRLEARASDAQINALAGAHANANAGANAVGTAGVGAKAGVGAAAGATKGATSVTGGVTGTVGGVIKRP